MALLAVISAVVALVSALIIAVGKSFSLPAGLLAAFQYGFTLIGDAVGFLYLLLPAEFWQFCGTALTLLLAAHAAYFAYSIGLSIWRIFMGGGE